MVTTTRPLSVIMVKAKLLFPVIVMVNSSRSFLKHVTRANEIEQKTMAMDAKGMNQRAIEDNLHEIYGADISQTLISKITDKNLPVVIQWQKRPLASIYPIVCFDGIVFKSRRDSQMINKWIPFWT